MNRSITIGLAMLTGAALGAAAVQGLLAQAKPPIYVIGEIDHENQEAYLSDFWWHRMSTFAHNVIWGNFCSAP
jgi:hypothetical protein